MQPAPLRISPKTAESAAGAISAGCIITGGNPSVERVLVGFHGYGENIAGKIKAFCVGFAAYYSLWYILTFFIHA